MGSKIFLIVGPTCTGKTTFLKTMRSLGYATFSTKSCFSAHELEKAKHIIQERDPTYAVKRCVQKIKLNLVKDPILFLWGIFHIKELEELKNLLDDVTIEQIAVLAPYRKRVEIAMTKGIENSSNYLIQKDKEWFNTTDMGLLIAESSFYVINDSSLEEFTKKARGVAEQIELQNDYAEKTVIGAMIMTKDKKILLIKKSNKWILPGGTVESGEHFKETLVREIYEETGLKISETLFEYAYRMYIADIDLRWIIYSGTLPLDSKQYKIEVLDKNEGIEAVEWYDIDKALQIVPSVTKNVLGAIVGGLNGKVPH